MQADATECQQLPTLLGVVGQQCCVRLHGPLRWLEIVSWCTWAGALIAVYSHKCIKLTQVQT